MKVLIACLLLLASGITFIVLENTFYQYVDKNGVLHESFFLPLGAIFILCAGIGLVFVLAKILMTKRKKHI
ncbi:MAG: DUF3955 domain-containing protein [Gammaproteobacteria bacterium]